MKTYIPFIIVSLAFLLLLTYEHELVHQQILSYYGIDSDVKFYLGWEGFGMETLPKNASLVTEQELKEIRFLNSLNEIFGYHFLVIFGFLVILGLLLIRRTEQYNW
jgi:urea transporter